VAVLVSLNLYNMYSSNSIGCCRLSCTTGTQAIISVVVAYPVQQVLIQWEYRRKL